MIYYTGADGSGLIQNNSSKSLGGWISSSQVPNDFLNNLFSDISFDNIKNKDFIFRVLAFKNISNTNIDFSVYTETPEDSAVKYEIGLILNSIDSDCNCPYFEQLQSEKSSPYFVTVRECELQENKITLTNVPQNNFVGIFIKQVIKENNQFLNKTCEDFNDEFLLQDSSQIDYEYVKIDNTINQSVKIVFEF